MRKKVIIIVIQFSNVFMRELNFTSLAREAGGWGEGRGENKRALKFYILFGDCGWEVQMYKKKKFFINNSFEAVIPFKEKYQGLLKLHLSLRGVSSGVGKK